MRQCAHLQLPDDSSPQLSSDRGKAAASRDAIISGSSHVSCCFFFFSWVVRALGEKLTEGPGLLRPGQGRAEDLGHIRLDIPLPGKNYARNLLPSPQQGGHAGPGVEYLECCWDLLHPVNTVFIYASFFFETTG